MTMALTFARAPWLLPERSVLPSALTAGARDQSVDEEKDERADDRPDEARPFSGLVPVHEMAEPTGNDRTCNAEQNGDQAPSGVASRHQQLGDGAGDPSDDDPPEPAVVRIKQWHQHRASPRFLLSFNRPSL